MDPQRRELHWPDDVLRLILDVLSLKAIVRVSRVSRRWRSVALEHPTYSRDVYVFPYPAGCYEDMHTPGKPFAGLHLFFHRLFYRHSMGNVVSLDMGLPAEPRLTHDALVTSACGVTHFRPLHDCFPRLIYLKLRVEEDYIPVAFAVILHPAPRLKTFQLCTIGDSSILRSWSLPQNLFAGHAPHLVYLSFNGPFVLPETTAGDSGSPDCVQRPLAALAAVKGVLIVMPWQYSTSSSLRLERFFLHCPLLERLRIHGDECSCLQAEVKYWTCLPPADALGLQHLEFTGTAIHYDQDDGDREEFTAWVDDTDAVVHAFAHPGMQTLEINSNTVTKPTLYAILAHLGPDALHLEATAPEAFYMRLTFRSIPRGVERTFTQLLSFWDQIDCSLFNECLEPIASQIQQLTVHRNHDVWNVILRMLPPTSKPGSPSAVLRRVEKLTVILGYADGDTRDERERFLDAQRGLFSPLYELQLPALRCLELVGPTAERPLSVDDLAYLMGRILQRSTRRKLRLILKDVKVQGDLRRIWAYFDRIELLP